MPAGVTGTHTIGCQLPERPRCGRGAAPQWPPPKGAEAQGGDSHKGLGAGPAGSRPAKIARLGGLSKHRKSRLPRGGRNQRKGYFHPLGTAPDNGRASETRREGQSSARAGAFGVSINRRRLPPTPAWLLGPPRLRGALSLPDGEGLGVRPPPGWSPPGATSRSWTCLAVRTGACPEPREP